MIANIIGVPKPPFRIMEPSGAPIINNTIQARARAIFLCHSILYFCRVFSCSRILLPFISRLFLRLSRLLNARSCICCRALSGSKAVKLLGSFFTGFAFAAALATLSFWLPNYLSYFSPYPLQKLPVWPRYLLSYF